jgi:disulfide bond formation protein DsbB
VEALTPYLVDILAPLTVAGLVGGGLLLLLYVRTLFSHRACPRTLKWVSDHALFFMFITAFSAALGSLFFSEIAMWAPCKLCWFQRVFLYPQVFIIGLAMFRHEDNVVPYLLLLSVLGMGVSLIHYGEQWYAILDPVNFDPVEGCDLTGVSCRATYVMRYGFVSIPLMALVPFFLNTIFCLLLLRCSKK